MQYYSGLKEWTPDAGTNVGESPKHYAEQYMLDTKICVLQISYKWKFVWADKTNIYQQKIDQRIVWGQSS